MSFKLEGQNQVKGHPSISSVEVEQSQLEHNRTLNIQNMDKGNDSTRGSSLEMSLLEQ